MGANNNHENGPIHCFSCHVDALDTTKKPPASLADVVCSTDPGLLINLAARRVRVNPRDRSTIFECHRLTSPILPAEPALSPERQVEQNSVFNVVRILAEIPFFGQVVATQSWLEADLDGTDLVVKITDKELMDLLESVQIEIQIKSSQKSLEKFVKQSFDAQKRNKLVNYNSLIARKRIVVNGNYELRKSFIVASILLQLEAIIGVLVKEGGVGSIKQFHEILSRYKLKIESIDNNLNSLLDILQINREMVEQNNIHLLKYLRTSSCNLSNLDSDYWQLNGNHRQPQNHQIGNRERGQRRDGRRKEKPASGVNHGGNGRSGSNGFRRK